MKGICYDITPILGAVALMAILKNDLIIA